MIQHNIEGILRLHSIIPVVNIKNEDEIEAHYTNLHKAGMRCIEITLRSDYAWTAIEKFKKRYGAEFAVGVGTVTMPDHIIKAKNLGVDFIVCPGLTNSLIQHLETCEVPFLPGACTPSDIMKGYQLGWRFFKFFPASLYGGIDALKTYGSVFPEVQFCPTGGIGEKNHLEYLALDNVISVGGSWLSKG